MIYSSFAQLIQQLSAKRRKEIIVAVVMAQDSHTLAAVCQAARENIVTPLLIGDKVQIEKQLAILGELAKNYMIIHVDNDTDATLKAAELVNNEQAHFIMKGLIQTATLMKALLSDKANFRTGKMISHLGVVQIPNYHKLIGITDAALNTYPDLQQKINIIKNAVATMLRIGFDTPKVAVLAATDQVNAKMPETFDAAELKRMNTEGSLTDCIVDGPLSYDLAISKEAAALKGIDSPVCGDADLLVVPNITVGNVLLKALRHSAKANTAGIVVGGKVPIVLTSRVAETESKYLPLVLAASATGMSNREGSTQCGTKS